MSPGGTHLRILVMYVLFSIRPSPICVDTLWFEILAFFKHLNKKSPDLSPVKALPVLVPPWAAGARPIIIILALKSPKPVTGLPQYSCLNFFFYLC